MTVQSHRIADGRSVLDFAAPVLFQGKTIGQVHLGIYEAPLTAVANLMLVLLAILTLVTVAAVARRHLPARAAPRRPIRVLRNSLQELGERPLRLPDRRDAQGRIRRALRASSTRPPPRSRRATSRRHRPNPCAAIGTTTDG